MRLIGSTQYAGALDELLKQIKQVYASADTLSVDFVENVRIAEGYVPTDSVMNLGEIAEILNSTKSGEVTYTVVKGDTWGQIANNNGMTAAEPRSAEPRLRHQPHPHRRCADALERRAVSDRQGHRAAELCRGRQL